MQPYDLVGTLDVAFVGAFDGTLGGALQRTEYFCCNLKRGTSWGMCYVIEEPARSLPITVRPRVLEPRCT